MKEEVIFKKKRCLLQLLENSDAFLEEISKRKKAKVDNIANEDPN